MTDVNRILQKMVEKKIANEKRIKNVEEYEKWKQLIYDADTFDKSTIVQHIKHLRGEIASLKEAVNDLTRALNWFLGGQVEDFPSDAIDRLKRRGGGGSGDSSQGSA